MSVDWDNLFAPLRAEVAPVFDVRSRVLARLSRESHRPADEPILRWMMVAAVMAASVVWAIALPRLTTPQEPRVSYVALIESLDVTTEIYSQR